MSQTSPAMPILVGTQLVDFRKGFDGLETICRQQLQQLYANRRSGRLPYTQQSTNVVSALQVGG